MDTPSYESAKRAALARKVRLFGGDIYAFGPRPDLIGRPGAAPAAATSRSIAASGFVPAHVAGAIPDGERGGGRTVAVAVNGTVAATGVTFTLEGSDDEQYSVIVPERSFKEGRNRVEVLLVDGDELEPI